MPQGNVLGPLLFLLYDIRNCSELFDFYLFADDSNLFYSHYKLYSLQQHVKTELQNVYEWLCSGTHPIVLLLRMPIRRWKSYKLSSLDFSGVFFLSRKLGGRSWVIPTAPTCVYLNTAFNGGICQQNMYFNMILQYLNSKKVLRARIAMQNDSKTNSIAKLSPGQ